MDIYFPKAVMPDQHEAVVGGFQKLLEKKWADGGEDLPFMGPWVPGNWKRSKLFFTLTFAQRAILRELVDLQWILGEEGLPDESERLRVACGASHEEWNEARPHVDRFFPVCEDGQRRNPIVWGARLDVLFKTFDKKAKGSSQSLTKTVKAFVEEIKDRMGIGEVTGRESGKALLDAGVSAEELHGLQCALLAKGISMKALEERGLIGFDQVVRETVSDEHAGEEVAGDYEEEELCQESQTALPYPKSKPFLKASTKSKRSSKKGSPIYAPKSLESRERKAAHLARLDGRDPPPRCRATVAS